VILLPVHVKLAFHGNDTDTDTDTNSPDTLIHPYVRYARFPREEVRVGVGVAVCVRVGAVECQLYTAQRNRLGTAVPTTMRNADV